MKNNYLKYKSYYTQYYNSDEQKEKRKIYYGRSDVKEKRRKYYNTDKWREYYRMYHRKYRAKKIQDKPTSKEKTILTTDK